MQRKTIDEILEAISRMTNVDVKNVLNRETLAHVASRIKVRSTGKSVLEYLLPCFATYDARQEARTLCEDPVFRNRYMLSEDLVTGYLTKAYQENKHVLYASRLADTIDRVTSAPGMVVETLGLLGGMLTGGPFGVAIAACLDEVTNIPEELIEIFFKLPAFYFLYKDKVFRPKAQQLLIHELWTSAIPVYGDIEDFRNLYVRAATDYITTKGLEHIQNDFVARTEQFLLGPSKRE